MRGDTMQIRLVHGGVVTYPPGATFGPRRLRDYEFVWIVDGQVVYHADGVDHEAPGGTVVLCRPGFSDAFTWDPRRPTRHAFFHFGVTGLPADLPPTRDWPIVRHLSEDDVIRPLFRYVLSFCRAGVAPPDQDTPMMAQRAIATMLGAFVTGRVDQVFEHERDDPEPVQRAMACMRRSLTGDPSAKLTLTALARAASVSPEHLCRLFRTAMGHGPMQVVMILRLEMALGLLARSNLNVAQIAQRVGFASAFHFSRRFKRAYGASPTQMRQRLAAGLPPPVTALLRKSRL